MSIPKFKVGDRVKWKDSDGCDRSGAVHGYDKSSQRYPVTESDFIVATWWHESHLSLDVPAEPKFKIGDRVKWAHFGKPSFGFVRARISDGWWKVEYKTGCMANFHESSMSLDVPEPKKFATKLEAELGAEIIKLHYDAADLDARLTKETGERHRERIAKEAAQKELAEANDMIGRFTKAQFDLSGQWRCERLAKESRQKELVEANDKIKRLKSLIGEM